MKRIAFISQSGNVMKSSLAQALAIEATRNKWSVALCDLDPEHQTSAQWMALRESHGIEPCCSVLSPRTARQAAQITGEYNLLIYDAPSRATQATPTIAKSSDIIIQPVPTGSTKDADLALLTFHQLLAEGIPAERMKFVLTRAGTEAEIQHTRKYLKEAEINGKVLDIDILEHAIFEKTSYRAAISDGHTITETPFLTVNQAGKAAIYQNVFFLT